MHDDLLQKLGQAARQRAASEPPPLDDRWDRLAAGTLDADEEAELRRLAESSVEERKIYEAFRPLGPQFHARVVQAIADLQPRPVLVPAPQPVPVRPPRPLPFLRRMVAWGAPIGAAAAAAVVALVIRVPMPLYVVAEISGGTRTTRGELAESPTFHSGDHFQASLRPETTVRRAGSLRAKAFLLHGDELRSLDAKTQIDESGAVRFTGTLDRDLPPGPWTLWLVVGRIGSLPDPERLRGFSDSAPVHERNWVAVPAALDVRTREPN